MESWAVHALKHVVAGSAMAMAHVRVCRPGAGAFNAGQGRATAPGCPRHKRRHKYRLWFNEEIEGDYASLVVLDAEKHPVTEVKPNSLRMTGNPSSCRCRS